MQLGLVDPVVSVTYRFSLAACILLIWCGFRRLPMRFTLQEHRYIFMQGLFLFGINYLLFYIAELYIASGLAAVIFSTIVLMNIVNGSLFLKSPIDRRVVFGGLLGLVGIGLVFKSEITTLSASSESITGIILSLVATLFASWGNIVSARNQRRALPIIQTNAIGMAYGAGIMFVAALVTGKTFAFDFSPIYRVASLSGTVRFGRRVWLLSVAGRQDRRRQGGICNPALSYCRTFYFNDLGRLSLDRICGGGNCVDPVRESLDYQERKRPSGQSIKKAETGVRFPL